MNNEEKIAIAMEAIIGNVCWLGISVERGGPKAEYVGIMLPSPYSSPTILKTSFHEDPWESLKLALNEIKQEKRTND
jgi:hypothetical protein